MKKKFLLIKISIAFILLISLSGCSNPNNDLPTVSITSPANESQVTGIVLIQASADSKTGIAKVEFYIDGKKKGEASQSPYEYSWDTTGISDLKHTITAKALDKAGKYASSSITVNLLVIPDTTTVLDDTTKQKLTQVSDDKSTLTFSSGSTQLENLKQGDVIILDSTTLTPEGLLRKVTDVQKNGDQVIVTTEQATLEEAIATGVIDWEKKLEESDIQKAIPLQKGVHIQKKKVAGKDLATFELSIEDIVLYDKDGNKDTTNDQVVANGSISISPSINFHLENEEAHIKKIVFECTMEEEAEINLETKVGVSLSKEIPLAKYSFSPIVFFVPPLPLPIVFVPQLELKIGVDGEVSIGITTGITQNCTTVSGLSYENGTWSPIGSITEGANYIPPKLSGEVSVKGYVGPEIALLIEGITGPYGNLFGYLKLEAALFENPWWKLYAGIESSIGVKLEVIGKDIAKCELQVIDYKKLLAQAETDNLAPEVTITNLHDGDIVYGTVSIQAQVVDKVSSAKNKKVEKAPSAVSKVEFYIDGTKIGEDMEAPYEYSWDTDALQYSSTHTIKAKAYDNAGNTGESQVVTVVIVDPQPPEVTITSPTNGVLVSATVLIQAQVVDKVSSAKNKKVEKAPSAVSKVEFYIDGTKIGEDMEAPYIYSWDTNKVINGHHTIKVKAIDKAENSGESQVVTVYVKNTGAITWQKTYGGIKSDFANSIQQTTDGGYIVAGYTNSFGAGYNDVYVLKLDENGDLQWQKTFGRTNYEWAYSIQQTTDGGYIVAGMTNSLGAGSSDVYVLKLNADGGLQWEKNFGGGDIDKAESIQQVADGGYIVAGGTASLGDIAGDVYVLKLDASGELLWQKTYGGVNWDVAHSIQQTTDGGYIVAGTTQSFGAGSWDVYVLKLDANGDATWSNTYGGTDIDEAYAIQQTADGGYIVSGRTRSFGAGSWDYDDDVYILKLNSIGIKEWEKVYDGGGSDEAESIQQTADGGYIVVGATDSFGAGGLDVYILKLDANGEKEWDNAFGGSSTDDAYSIQRTIGGGYIVAGATGSFGAGSFDVYVLKLDENGNTGANPK